jgi:hypothetical protein
MLTIEQIHADGARRHKEAWFKANLRAIEAIASCRPPIRATSREMQEAIPRIVLRILDGAEFDRGRAWNGEEWVKLVGRN